VTRIEVVIVAPEKGREKNAALTLPPVTRRNLKKMLQLHRLGQRETPCYDSGPQKKNPDGEMVLRHAGLSIVALLALAPAHAETFETRLSPSPLTQGTRINITGQGSALVQWDGNILSVSGNFTGLASNATTAEIYDGPGIGIPGSKLFDLSLTPDRSGTIWGSLTMTRKQLAELRAGHLYVQINSEKAPDGNLTGWLLPPHPFPGEGVPVAGPGFLPQFDVPQQTGTR
jgi:hypothetical protein